MSSTDDDRTNRAIQKFIRRRLLPAIRKTELRGVRHMPTGPDETVSSYYSPHRSRRGLPCSEALSPYAAEGVGAALRDLWRSEGHEELVELAADLQDLATKLRVSEPQSAEISPYVYEMF